MITIVLLAAAVILGIVFFVIASGRDKAGKVAVNAHLKPMNTATKRTRTDVSNSSDSRAA